MECNSGYCHSIDNTVLRYPFLITSHTEVFSCEVFTIEIVAHSIDSTITTNQHTTTSCKPLDKYCKLRSGSIRVWEMDIIHECPFTHIQTIFLENMVDNMWISKQQNKLFQITNKRTICSNITAMQTGEGFILVDYKIAKSMNLKNSSNTAGDNEVKLIDETLLTEMDYQNQLVLALTLNTFRIMNEKICQLYKSILSILR